MLGRPPVVGVGVRVGVREWGVESRSLGAGQRALENLSEGLLGGKGGRGLGPGPGGGRCGQPVGALWVKASGRAWESGPAQLSDEQEATT